jgi:hypothetical protein
MEVGLFIIHALMGALLAGHGAQKLFGIQLAASAERRRRHTRRASSGLTVGSSAAVARTSVRFPLSRARRLSGGVGCHSGEVAVCRAGDMSPNAGRRDVLKRKRPTCPDCRAGHHRRHRPWWARASPTLDPGMGRPWLLLSLSLVGALGGCDLPVDLDEESEGLEALQAARAKARAARYLVVLDEACCNRDGRPVHQRLQFAPGLTVISQNGRLVLWARRDVEYTLRRDGGCYERHTEFSRGDLREVRRTTVVPYEVDEAVARKVGSRTLIRWQVHQGVDSPGIEGQLSLDPRGRPEKGRERTMRWGAKPPSHWIARRYRFPSRLRLAAPRPSCTERAARRDAPARAP